MITLSIVIVNYNTKEFLKKCIQSLLDNVSDNLSYEIIVVDNASRDGTAEEISNLKSQISNLKFIMNKENVGFSKGNNIGMKQAKGKYILFLNSDTIVYKKTLERMIEFMDEHKDAGAATCYLEMMSGELDDAAHRGFPTPWRAFCHFSGLSKLFPKSMIYNGYHLGWKDLDRVHEIDALAGAFMLVRREAGEEVGWWDEDYFFYGEDLDFCYKLHKTGWKIYFVPDVKIRHYKGVSGGIKKVSEKITVATKETKKRSTKARFDAMHIFYKKHYTHQYPKVLTFAVMKAIAVKRAIAIQRI